jgi:predicted porin
MFGGLLKSTSLAALVAVAGIAAAGSANAADLGGNCCADLEERIAELEATTARKGNRKVSLTVSGLVNEQVMVWDDGVETNAYQTTNESTRTRFRFVGNAKINADWSAGYLLEIGVRGANAKSLNQNADDAGQGFDVRHSAWWLQSKQLGRLWVGQTSSATDGIQEINLANVSAISPNTQYLDWSGGFLLRNSSGAQSTISLTTLVNGLENPGEGTRFNVVKYETPAFFGFIASAAWGEDDVWDVALRYAGEFSGFKLAAGIGYQRWTDGTSNVAAGGAANTNPERGCVDSSAVPVIGSDVKCDELGLSASVMHVPTGLFVTGAYGYREDSRRAALNIAGNKSRDEVWSVMGGIEQKFFPLGKTTVYGEYLGGEYGVNGLQTFGANSQASSLGFGNVAQIASSEVSIWGIGFNQAIDAAAMDVYVAYRNTQVDVTSSAGAKANLQDFQTVLMGARIQF